MPEIFLMEGKHEDYKNSPHTYRVEIEHTCNNLFSESILRTNESPFILRNLEPPISMEELERELDCNLASSNSRASKLKNPSSNYLSSSFVVRFAHTSFLL